MTLVVPRTITVAEAYQLFLSALDLVGLTVEPNGRFLRIIETSGRKASAIPLYLASATSATPRGRAAGASS